MELKQKTSEISFDKSTFAHLTKLIHDDDL